MDWKAPKPCLISVGKSREEHQTSRYGNTNTWDCAELGGLSKPVSQGSVLGTHVCVAQCGSACCKPPTSAITNPAESGTHFLHRDLGVTLQANASCWLSKNDVQQKLLLAERRRSWISAATGRLGVQSVATENGFVWREASGETGGPRLAEARQRVGWLTGDWARRL